MALLLALALASSMIVTEAEEQQALQNAMMVNKTTAAKSCVDKAALRYARYTDEKAAEVANAAALSCASAFEIYNETAKNIAIRDAVARRAAAAVMEWRARVGENGPAEWEDISKEIEANH